MKKAFTIVELLVAVALLAILVAISGLVFAAAVRAYRTASAATEIAAKLQVITQQLDDDLRGLRKDGEFIMVWSPGPELTRDGFILDENANGIPDRYLSFDRLFFFTNGNFQSYDAQPAAVDIDGDGDVDANDSKMVYSNLARVCYSFGRDAQNTRASFEPKPEKRLFCRTQHLISGDADLPLFPDMSVPWNAINFEAMNFSYEYQTMIMENWLAMTKIQEGIWENLTLNERQNLLAKMEKLSCILDLRMSCRVWSTAANDWHIVDSTVLEGGPKIDQTTPQTTSNTMHQLFMQGVGQFHIQMWWYDTALNRYRWYPEIDPDGDGDYSEGVTFDNGHTDYPLVGNAIDTVNLAGRWVWDIDSMNFWVGPALKFTFTLYDSNGVFKDGKTFTHIVYLND